MKKQNLDSETKGILYAQHNKKDMVDIIKENVFLNLRSWTKHLGQGHANFVIWDKKEPLWGVFVLWKPL